MICRCSKALEEISGPEVFMKSQYFDFMDFCNGQIAAPFPNKAIKFRENIFILHFILKNYVLICSVLPREQMI